MSILVSVCPRELGRHSRRHIQPSNSSACLCEVLPRALSSNLVEGIESNDVVPVVRIASLIASILVYLKQVRAIWSRRCGGMWQCSRLTIHSRHAISCGGWMVHRLQCQEQFPQLVCNEIGVSTPFDIVVDYWASLVPIWQWDIGNIRQRCVPSLAPVACSLPNFAGVHESTCATT